MNLELRHADATDAPRADGALGLPATAWTNGLGAIYVVPPYDRQLFARRRIAHEVEHNLEPDFEHNADHHPWWHFCGRVGHGLRLRDAHLNPRSLELADTLLRDGRASSQG